MTNNNGIFFCTIIIVRKKVRGNDVTSCDVTSGYDVTSGHVTDVTSGYDVTSGDTPFPNYDGLQVLKTVKYPIKPLTSPSATTTTAYRLCQIYSITAQNQKRNLLFKTIL